MLDPAALMRMLSQPAVPPAVGAGPAPLSPGAPSLSGMQSLMAQFAAGASASASAGAGAGATPPVGAAAGAPAAGAALPPPLQLLGMMQQGMGGMPPEVSELAATVGSAVSGAKEWVDSVQAAEQYFKPQQLVQDAIHAVQELPDGVKAQVGPRVPTPPATPRARAGRAPRPRDAGVPP